MIALLWLLPSLIFCEEKKAAQMDKTSSYTQQLVFGKDNKNGHTLHYCDVKLTPTRTVTGVTIFLKTDGKDAAVPKCTVTPTESPSSKGYFRIEIPDIIEKDGSVYNFQFAFNDVDVIFSETWAYDLAKKQFSLTSAIKRKFYQSKTFIVTACATAALVVSVLGFMVYKSIRKRRSAI